MMGLSNFIITMSDVLTRNVVIDWFNLLADNDKQQIQNNSSVFERLQEIIGRNAEMIRYCQGAGKPWRIGLRKLIEKMDEHVANNQRVKSERAVARFIQQEACMLKELGVTREEDKVVKRIVYQFDPSGDVLHRCELMLYGGSTGKVNDDQIPDDAEWVN
jgi:hypothetical protein